MFLLIWGLRNLLEESSGINVSFLGNASEILFHVHLIHVLNGCPGIFSSLTILPLPFWNTLKGLRHILKARNSCDKGEGEVFSFLFLGYPEAAKHYKMSMEATLLGLQKKTTNFNWQEQAGFSPDSCCRQQGFGSGVIFQNCKPFKIRMFVSFSSSVFLKHFLHKVKEAVK